MIDRLTPLVQRVAAALGGRPPAPTGARITYLARPVGTPFQSSTWHSQSVRRRYAGPETAWQRLILDDNLAALGYELGAPVGAPLLDVGCGDGRHGPALAPRWDYTGVDLNPEQVADCQARFPGLRYLAGGTDQFADRQFSVVFASGTLQYVPAAEEALRDWRRVSAGWLVLTRVPVLRRAATVAVEQTVDSPAGRESFTFHAWNRADLLAMLASVGLRAVWQDYGVEHLTVEGVAEPVVTNSFVLAVDGEERAAAPPG